MSSSGALIAAHERALAIRERALGPAHPENAVSLVDMSEALRDVGEYERPRGRPSALALSEGGVGPDHPRVALMLDNLGHVLFELGDLARAQALFEREPVHLSEKRPSALDHLRVAMPLTGPRARGRSPRPDRIGDRAPRARAGEAGEGRRRRAPRDLADRSSASASSTLGAR